VEFKEIVNKIIKSPEVTNLIDIIRKFDDKPEIHDLVVYIDDKLRSQRR
jgi:hypothetical protein